MSGAAHKVIWSIVSLGVLAVCVVVMRPGQKPTEQSAGGVERNELPRPEDGAGSRPAKSLVDPEVARADRPMVVTWAKHWNEARKLAAARDQLVFLYLGLEARTCPPCRYLETEFFVDPALAELNRIAAPLYIYAEAESVEIPAANRALLTRLKPLALPILVLLSPDGGVIHRQSAGLYAIYGLDRKIADEAPEGLLTSEGLLSIVKAKTASARATTRRIQELGRTKGPQAAFELTQLLADREQYAQAAAVARASLATDPSVEIRVLLASVERRAGNTSAAEAIYDKLLLDEAEHPESLQWRLELTLLRLNTVLEHDDSEAHAEVHLEEHLAEIATRASTDGKAPIEARARAELAEMEKRAEHTEALRTQLAWFARNYLSPDDPRPLEASIRLQVAELAIAAGLLDDAVAHAERLQAEHPTSPEAQVIKHGLYAVWRNEARKQREAKSDG